MYICVCAYIYAREHTQSQCAYLECLGLVFEPVGLSLQVSSDLLTIVKLLHTLMCEATHVSHSHVEEVCIYIRTHLYTHTHTHTHIQHVREDTCRRSEHTHTHTHTHRMYEKTPAEDQSFS